MTNAFNGVRQNGRKRPIVGKRKGFTFAARSFEELGEQGIIVDEQPLAALTLAMATRGAA